MLMFSPRFVSLNITSSTKRATRVKKIHPAGGGIHFKSFFVCSSKITGKQKKQRVSRKAETRTIYTFLCKVSGERECVLMKNSIPCPTHFYVTSINTSGS